MLCPSDKALAQSMDEIESLRMTLKSITTALESYEFSREQLTDRLKLQWEPFTQGARRKRKKKKMEPAIIR